MPLSVTSTVPDGTAPEPATVTVSPTFVPATAVVRLGTAVTVGVSVAVDPGWRPDSTVASALSASPAAPSSAPPAPGVNVIVWVVGRAE